MVVGGYLYLKFIHFYKVQSGAIPAVASLVQLETTRRYGNNAIFPIDWSANFVAGLDTIHPNCMALSFHKITVQQLGAEVVGAYM